MIKGIESIKEMVKNKDLQGIAKTLQKLMRRKIAKEDPKCMEFLKQLKSALCKDIIKNITNRLE